MNGVNVIWDDRIDWIVTHTHTHTHTCRDKKNGEPSRDLAIASSWYRSRTKSKWLERWDRYYRQIVRWKIRYTKNAYVNLYHNILPLLLSFFFFGKDENPFRRGWRRSSKTVCTQQRMRRTFSLSIASTTDTHTCLELFENLPNQFPQILESCFSQSRPSFTIVFLLSTSIS